MACGSGVSGAGIWAVLGACVGVGGLGLLGSGPASADEPEAPLDFLFEEEHRIYRLAGDEACEEIVIDGLEVERCLTFQMLSDARGRYEGTATLTFEGDFDGTLTGPLRGKQRANRRGIQFQLSSRLRGFLDIPLLGDVKARAKVDCRGDIDLDGNPTEECLFRLQRPGARPSREDVPFAATVEGGDWNLVIDTLLDTGRGRLEGSATDSFGFSYRVRGRYDENRDESKLKVQGLPGSLSKSAKIKLKDLRTPNPQEGDGRATYRLLGARGRADVSAEPPAPPPPS